MNSEWRACTSEREKEEQEVAGEEREGGCRNSVRVNQEDKGRRGRG